MLPYFEIHFAGPDTEVSNLFLEQFCSLYNLKSLINEPTHFKSVDNPSCTDLILTNHPKCFQNSGVYDFHKLTFTVLETYFQKAKPRIIKYRVYKHSDNNEFRDELIRELSSNNMQSDDLAGFTNFLKLSKKKKTPLKEGYVRYNQAKFMKKNLQKAIMNRCRLLNRYKKEKTEATRSAYKRQINFCVKLLRTTKKEFHNNLNVNFLENRKTFVCR